ncbi:flavin reductase family protein [Streptomyces sp. TLI_171]|uniref:flavin reductase family protein n=1 Tax=Streptomyces sp. TLI_171 TaxID=1938859 RepID=UPI000C195365|nr:flavin reductase family protein [Streptomyces sp. TLI_171]RKE22788.1 flavin reductase (DIM6/NTAB) family NADH-FMN oxidoreductase RutF [Streptomyces sp. TLI_171]
MRNDLLPHRVIEPQILYFGTPVVLLSTVNPDGTPNLAPISSAWALDRTVVLGLGAAGRTVQNLAARPELVVNVPGPGLWRQVERLGATTGRPDAAHFVRDKFAHAGLTPVPADTVAAPRVAECPLQLEARVADLRPDATGEFRVVEARVLRVHAAEAVTVPGTDHVEPAAWSPLVYNFRHYFGLGPELGHSARSRTPRD